MKQLRKVSRCVLIRRLGCTPARVRLFDVHLLGANSRTVHRTYDELVSVGDARRARDRQQMAADMADIVTTTDSVRGAALHALAAINAIPD